MSSPTTVFIMFNIHTVITAQETMDSINISAIQGQIHGNPVADDRAGAVMWNSKM